MGLPKAQALSLNPLLPFGQRFSHRRRHEKRPTTGRLRHPRARSVSLRLRFSLPSTCCDASSPPQEASRLADHLVKIETLARPGAMGVGGRFWDLLKPYARHEGFGYLRNKRVAVDLSFWIVQHETAIKKRSFARNPHLRLTFFRTINLFSKVCVVVAAIWATLFLRAKVCLPACTFCGKKKNLLSSTRMMNFVGSSFICRLLFAVVRLVARKTRK